MSINQRLAGLQSSQLKYLAFLMGLANSGSKLQLGAAIQQQISTDPPLEGSGRIVSVDMGIRNLGICVLEASDTAKAEFNQVSNLKILDWKKLDLLNQGVTSSEAVESDPNAEASTKIIVDPTIFRPHKLSRIAVEISTQLLHTYKPQHILIERQRFRSGGASAVQEWTLRVNMLESMLWASFETLRRESHSKTSFPTLHEVDPKRVARYWCDRPSGFEILRPEALLDSKLVKKQTLSELSAKHAKPQTDKKAKIGIVRSWLSDKPQHQESEVRLQLSEKAQAVADAFPLGARRGPPRTLGTETAPNKLDDLADCLLQGATWLRWLENTRGIKKLLEGGIDK